MPEDDRNAYGSAGLKEKIAHDLVIRRVRQDELNKLVSVYISAYEGLEEYAYTSGSEVRSYMRWLYRGDPDGFFVAELDGKIVGFVAVHTNWWDKRIGRTAEIHELVVHKSYQCMGIGTKLMKCAIEHALECGCNFVSLWVGAENKVAREWYRKLGFEEVGEGYYWVRMVKRLSTDHAEEND
jgi:ribosomal protein S18 acetylase RimI-like enzyme